MQIAVKTLLIKGANHNISGKGFSQAGTIDISSSSANNIEQEIDAHMDKMLVRILMGPFIIVHISKGILKSFNKTKCAHCQ